MKVVKEIPHKFLFFKWYETICKHQKMALVFIPWKHNLKELRIIFLDDLEIINNSIIKSFVNVDEFISPFEEEQPYYVEYKIKEFNGYEFIYTNKNFIADIKQTPTKCFEILYEELPELLSVNNGI